MYDGRMANEYQFTMALRESKQFTTMGNLLICIVSSLSSRFPGVPRGRDSCYSTWHGADEAQLTGNRWHVGSGSDEGSGIMAPDRLVPMSSFWAPAVGSQGEGRGHQQGERGKGDEL